MGLVDTHCHLQLPAFADDRQAVLCAALAELDWLVVVGDHIETSRLAVALTQESVYAAVGIHPHHADLAVPAALETLRALTAHPRVRAIGEIGLDYYYEHTPRAIQREAFRAQLALAVELGLPVIIHNRDAHEDLAGILDEFGKDLPRGVMHCFSGDPAFAAHCVDWGLFVSFAGNVTFPKAQALREAAKATPLDRLLIETDSPYLAPQPARGKRCEPIHVRHTAQLLAELKGTPLDELARHTTDNACRLFGVAAAGEVSTDP